MLQVEATTQRPLSVIFYLPHLKSVAPGNLATDSVESCSPELHSLNVSYSEKDGFEPAETAQSATFWGTQPQKITL